MSTTLSGKKFGFYAAAVAALLCLAAAIFYQCIGGRFGLRDTHNGDCYDLVILALLGGSAIVSAVCLFLNKGGLASFAATVGSGVSIALFIHKCYWYVVDVFVGIDEPKGQFDPNFFIFVGLMAAAFIVGEIAVYTKKTA